MIYENTYFLGIRHHGPGSATSVLRALDEIRPDLILLEGPPEAETVMSLAIHSEMKPPVAMLIYVPDDLTFSSIFPLVKFSPEWQVIRYALRQQIPLRFMDLPQTHHLALQREANEALKNFAAQDTPPAEPVAPADIHPYWQESSHQEDPLTLLAQAADFEDGERWWEYMVEQRQEGLPVFSGIAEAMQSVRAAVQTEAGLPYREALREAWMRKTLQQAKGEGFQRIAVICGAWHVPALTGESNRKEDEKLLKGLPKCPVNATWIPWSYDRISQSSGYGAGVKSPAWYQFLWESRDKRRGRTHYIAATWLSKVARLLRSEGFDVASASVIDAVRLSETLAALRDKSMPDLSEFKEAALAALCFGDVAKLTLIEQKLIIGNSLGSVPDETPMTPLQADLARLQRSLRLKPEVDAKALELDLRTPTDLERSKLFYRLALLNIPWAKPARPEGRSKGTFKEAWRLQWQPEFTIRLIEMTVWGGTIGEAATGIANHHLQTATDLAPVIQLIDKAMLADLANVVDQAVRRLEEMSAVSSDVGQLMDALPALARVLRYGNVRASDTQLLEHVASGFVARIMVGLPAVCYALDDDSAAAMLRRIEACHEAVQLLQNEEYSEAWWSVVGKLVDLADLHGLVAGKCCRLLLSAHKMDGDEAARRLNFALSVAGTPNDAAAWLEGLLRGSGLLLVHDNQLWGIVDGWLAHLDGEVFLQVLPLLRRTFSTFAVGERRMIGSKVKNGHRPARAGQVTANSEIDWQAALAGLPIVARIFGLEMALA